MCTALAASDAIVSGSLRAGPCRWSATRLSYREPPMTFVLHRMAGRLVNVQQNNVQQKPCASQKDQACPKQRHVQA